MKKFASIFTLFFTTFLLLGCSSVAEIKPDENPKVASKVLLASGYSKLRNLPQLTEDQNRLAIEQSAKLNAYRQLAKQLYNVRLSKDLLVADQIIKDESYRIYFDLFLREAKVVQSKNIADLKLVELELDLLPRFYQCISATVEVVSLCLHKENKIPFTRIGYQRAPMTKVNLSCASIDCGMQLSMSGFSTSKPAFDRAMLNIGLYDLEWSANIALKSFMQYFFPTGYLIN